MSSRSLMIIAVMGIAGMVAITAFGGFFVGKVGGADSVFGLKKDVAQIFGSSMSSPGTLSIKVRRKDDASGLLVEYALAPELAENDRALAFHMKRVADFILRQPAWQRRAAFVTLRLTLPDGGTIEKRFVRAEPPV